MHAAWRVAVRCVEYCATFERSGQQQHPHLEQVRVTLWQLPAASALLQMERHAHPCAAEQLLIALLFQQATLELRLGYPHLVRVLPGDADVE